MRSTLLTGRLAVLASLAAMLMTGCASSGGGNATSGVRAKTVSYSGKRVSEQWTRRGTESHEELSARFGTPRGRKSEDVIPVGARITAVHVAFDDAIRAIWLSYERNGHHAETPRRGGMGGTVQTFKLGSREKIVALRAHGQPALRTIEIATNERIAILGAPVPPDAPPWHTGITTEEKRWNVGVGLITRADDALRQLTLRIQVRSK
jgi:hypothetical protein